MAEPTKDNDQHKADAVYDAMMPQVEITYSETGRYYYVRPYATMHGFWLTTDTMPEADARQICTDNPWITGAAFSDGTARLVYSFTFFDIKSGRRTAVPETHHLAVEYKEINEARRH
jgi:hypothetical protein